MRVSLASVVALQILAARPEDSGTYVCTARNMEGSTDTRVEVMVDGGAQVPSAPVASVSEPLLIVVEGQTVTLPCEAHGNVSVSVYGQRAPVSSVLDKTRGFFCFL